MAQLGSLAATDDFNTVMRASQGFGEQGNIGKILKGTREHEPIFRKLYKLKDENMVSKFIRGEKGTKQDKHGNMVR
mgnify:CR=1 FL=1